MNIKVLYILGIFTILFIIVAIIIIINISPYPVIFFAKHTAFKIPKETRVNQYDEGNVTVLVNETYTSAYKNNQFDLYLPKKQIKGEPIIAWVHGGGFVGGDKLEEKEFATKLAEKGYAVAVMNYALVPETKYPIPVIQTSEFLAYLKNHAENYSINFDNLFIAGDSAGAQIASQFITTQTNEVYRKLMSVDQVIKQNQIKGSLLYCGVYDVPEVVHSYSIPPVKFMFQKIGWGYAQDKNWLHGKLAESSVISNFVTADFPPAYITDGNTFSFEEQGKKLVEVLKSKGISVSQRFFLKSEYKTAHEYQFEMASEPAKIVFKDTLVFLNKHKQK
ncbi:alpha/beta hydrolase [Enterococcus wangshanyuanii]|uniref:Lipase n=1 Tax=Enterococcus wangshanyuanii TaxID=2005703 RepID=A0ABQ1NG76_9ENTE|nr:alpha/beta hydrolase [Enterococcus wangshanyuanii]GGC76109.1 lipase [Enterococcus wangshanyuanii]